MSSNGTTSPVSEKIQNASFTVRLTSTDKEALDKQAERAGISLSEWARDILLATPEYDPHTQELRQVWLEQSLEHHLTESATQYKHFLRASEELFSPLAQQLSNHREWMKGTLTNFAAEVTKTISGLTGTLERLDQRAAARLKESDRMFYARWLYVCVITFLLAAVSGFLFGRWAS